MAALDFPDNPVPGELYGVSGMVWRWDGARWASTSGPSGARGAVAYAQMTVDQTIATTAMTDLAGMSVTFAADPSRMYRTSVFFLASSTVVNDDINADICDAAGNRKQLFPSPYLDPATSLTMSASLVETGLSGSITRKVRAWRTGTGTMTIAGAPTYPRYILVEDITYDAGSGGPGSVQIPYALGIVAVGVPTNRAGVPITTTENIGPPISFTTQVGRRYKFRCNGVRAATASPTAYLAMFLTGPGISGRIDWYTLLSAAYGSLQAEVVFDGNGVAGSYTAQLAPGAASGVAIWTEPNACGYYLEDMGPVR